MARKLWPEPSILDGRNRDNRGTEECSARGSASHRSTDPISSDISRMSVVRIFSRELQQDFPQLTAKNCLRACCLVSALVRTSSTTESCSTNQKWALAGEATNHSPPARPCPRCPRSCSRRWRTPTCSSPWTWPPRPARPPCPGCPPPAHQCLVV